MRPSSSPSERPYGGLLGRLPGDPSLDEVVGDRALVAAMLRAEGALATAQAEVGLAPVAAARRGRPGRRPRPPTTPTSSVPRRPPRATPWCRWPPGSPATSRSRTRPRRGWVHRGATSQDILDTALMIVAAEATGRLLSRLDQCTDALVRLARTHASTLMAGRTLGQVAAPTTFGLKVTGWLAGVDAASRRLRDSRARLAVQLGGPVGTGAAWSPSLPDLLPAFAQATGLASAVPWHTERSRVVELATSLGQAVAACAKIATDVIALSQNEIGELREGAEPGRGGSSAMPHKQNPVGSVLVRAAALRSPGLVATVLSAAVHEGERATGAWHAEWSPLRELLHLAGGAAALTADVLDRLEVRRAERWPTASPAPGR